MNLLASDDSHIFSKGEFVDTTEVDSVMIAISDLRKVNSKLIELKYEREINSNLRDVINKDSALIEEYRSRSDRDKFKARKYKRQRNTATFGGLSIFVALLLSLFK